MREMAGSAATPAARCRNWRRRSFIALPSGDARDQLRTHARAIASINRMAFRACQRHIERISNWRGRVSRWSDQNGQPGVGLGAVRDELAALQLIELHPVTEDR